MERDHLKVKEHVEVVTLVLDVSKQLKTHYLKKDDFLLAIYTD